jgi:hypothetical protein
MDSIRVSSEVIRVPPSPGFFFLQKIPHRSYLSPTLLRFTVYGQRWTVCMERRTREP